MHAQKRLFLVFCKILTSEFIFYHDFLIDIDISECRWVKKISLF